MDSSDVHVVLGMNFLDSLRASLQIWEMHPQNYLRYLLFYRNMDLPIETTPSGKLLIGKEWGEWERDYLPVGGVKGQTVLDVGAGCGETAWFFFRHGAKRVICIEPDKEKFDKLCANARKMGWDIWAINRKFERMHLYYPFHWAKIDCEGGEIELLKEKTLPRMVVEIHFKWLAERLTKQFPQMKAERKYPPPFRTWMGRIE
jgi:hypothetical protein